MSSRARPAEDSSTSDMHHIHGLDGYMLGLDWKRNGDGEERAELSVGLNKRFSYARFNIDMATKNAHDLE
ncbi:hypothetical protein TCAL_16750 [Tigriopus californicus]|uniref:Uncharacterized protein n=1 Tax=Tigriopus californicus TaxID=6832 RepID=A0A553PTX2_TIGCA|nr:hypothetical protein TCAL_16750 [Tigriopus californicus]